MPADVFATLHDAADAAVAVLAEQTDWGLSGERDTQYLPDLTTDAAIRAVIAGAGMGMLSEESGTHRLDAEFVAVVDPLDGSTNASQRLAWYATSICVVRGGELVAAVVHDHGTGHRFAAERGSGASRDGERFDTPAPPPLNEAIIGISGLPPAPLGWAQFRSFGAAALDLCAVADGRLHGFVDCSVDAHGVWDYLGAQLICEEAGATVADAHGRALVTLDHHARRTPVAGGATELLDALLAERHAVLGA